MELHLTQRPGAAGAVIEAMPPKGAACLRCRRAGRGQTEATTMQKGAWGVWTYLCAACAGGLAEMAAIDFTKVDIKSIYRDFNRRFFHGQLPDDTPLKFSSTLKRATGVTTAKVKTTGRIDPMVKRGLRQARPDELSVYNYSITMSTKLRYEEELFDAFLLHEMVHLWLYLNGWPWAGHGRQFLEKAREVGHLAGVQIPLTHTLTGTEELGSDEREMGVLLLEPERPGDRALFLMFAPKAMDTFRTKARLYAANYRGFSTAKLYLVRTQLHGVLPVRASSGRGLKLSYVQGPRGQQLTAEIAQKGRLVAEYPLGSVRAGHEGLELCGAPGGQLYEALAAAERNVLRALIDYQRAASNSRGMPAVMAEDAYERRVLDELLELGLAEYRDWGGAFHYRVVPRGYKALGVTPPAWAAKAQFGGVAVEAVCCSLEEKKASIGAALKALGVKKFTVRGLPPSAQQALADAAKWTRDAKALEAEAEHLPNSPTDSTAPVVVPKFLHKAADLVGALKQETLDALGGIERPTVVWELPEDHPLRKAWLAWSDFEHSDALDSIRREEWKKRATDAIENMLQLHAKWSLEAGGVAKTAGVREPSWVHPRMADVMATAAAELVKIKSAMPAGLLHFLRRGVESRYLQDQVRQQREGWPSVRDGVGYYPEDKKAWVALWKWLEQKAGPKENFPNSPRTSTLPFGSMEISRVSVSGSGKNINQHYTVRIDTPAGLLTLDRYQRQDSYHANRFKWETEQSEKLRAAMKAHAASGGERLEHPYPSDLLRREVVRDLFTPGQHPFNLTKMRLALEARREWVLYVWSALEELGSGGGAVETLGKVGTWNIVWNPRAGIEVTAAEKMPREGWPKPSRQAVQWLMLSCEEAWKLLTKKIGIQPRHLAGPIMLTLKVKQGMEAGHYRPWDHHIALLWYREEIEGAPKGNPRTDRKTWTLVHEVAHRLYSKGLTSNGRAYWVAFIEALGDPFTEAEVLAILNKVAKDEGAVAQALSVAASNVRSAAVSDAKASVGLDLWWYWGRRWRTTAFDPTSEEGQKALREFGDWLRKKRYSTELPTEYANSDPEEAWPEVVSDLAMDLKSFGKRATSDYVRAVIQKVLGAARHEGMDESELPPLSEGYDDDDERVARFSDLSELRDHIRRMNEMLSKRHKFIRFGKFGSRSQVRLPADLIADIEGGLHDPHGMSGELGGGPVRYERGVSAYFADKHGDGWAPRSPEASRASYGLSDYWGKMSRFFQAAVRAGEVYLVEARLIREMERVPIELDYAPEEALRDWRLRVEKQDFPRRKQAGWGVTLEAGTRAGWVNLARLLGGYTPDKPWAFPATYWFPSEKQTQLMRDMLAQHGPTTKRLTPSVLDAARRFAWEPPGAPKVEEVPEVLPTYATGSDGEPLLEDAKVVTRLDPFGKQRKLPRVYLPFRVTEGAMAEPLQLDGPPGSPLDELLGLASLGVPRREMPQIPGDRTQAFLDWLSEQGIRHERRMIPAGDLHPTQREFNYDKIVRFAAKGQHPRLHYRKAVLVSSDYYVLDGHHRWAEVLRASPREPVNCIVFSARISKLLELAKAFPLAGERKGIGERLLAEKGSPNRRARREAAKAAAAASGLPPAWAQQAAVKKQADPTPASARHPVTKAELDALERYLDALFRGVGLDIEFTRHFFDRVNDARNKVQITAEELGAIFRLVHKRFANKIKGRGKNWEAVIADLGTDINVPFVVNYNPRTGLELVAKTVMRKKGFLTSNPKLSVNTAVENRLDLAGAPGVKVPATVGAIVEVLDRPVPHRWQRRGGGEWIGHFVVGGADYEFKAEIKAGIGKAIVQFYLTPEAIARLGVTTGGIGISGTGSAGTVFATALNMIVEMVKGEPEVVLVEYTAKEASRQVFYKRLNKVLAQRLGKGWTPKGPFNWGGGVLTFQVKWAPTSEAKVTSPAKLEAARYGKLTFSARGGDRTDWHYLRSDGPDIRGTIHHVLTQPKDQRWGVYVYRGTNSVRVGPWYADRDAAKAAVPELLADELGLGEALDPGYYLDMVRKAKVVLDRTSPQIAQKKAHQGLDWVYVNRTLRDTHSKALGDLQLAQTMLRRAGLPVEEIPAHYLVYKESLELPEEARMVPCTRCNGSGYIKAYSHVMGGVCFKCGGSGKQAAPRGRSRTIKTGSRRPEEYFDQIDFQGEGIITIWLEGDSKKDRHVWSLRNWEGVQLEAGRAPSRDAALRQAEERAAQLMQEGAASEPAELLLEEATAELPPGAERHLEAAALRKMAEFVPGGRASVQRSTMVMGTRGDTKRTHYEAVLRVIQGRTRVAYRFTCTLTQEEPPRWRVSLRGPLHASGYHSLDDPLVASGEGSTVNDALKAMKATDTRGM